VNVIEGDREIFEERLVRRFAMGKGAGRVRCYEQQEYRRENRRKSYSHSASPFGVESRSQVGYLITLRIGLRFLFPIGRLRDGHSIISQ
jgi:hypothetical protein